MSVTKIFASCALLAMTSSTLASHIKSIQGKEFDLMRTGTYTLFQDSTGLKVQGLMTTCGNEATCGTGIAVGFKNSVARFSLDANGVISYTQASELVSLSVEQTIGNCYRVSIKEDSSSYIDINVAQWNNNAYLDTSYTLSESFKQETKGLVSYDGTTEVETFAASYTVEESASLFSCTDCSSIVGF